VCRNRSMMGEPLFMGDQFRLYSESPVRNRELQYALDRVRTGINGLEGANLFDAFDVHADLQCVIDILRELGENPEALERVGCGDTFVEPSVIESLRQSSNQRFDLSKVVRFCEELNDCYSAGNCIASTLLIRALINHVPPVFGHTTFQQVVSQAGKSVRELLKPLEEVSRDVADLHTHSLIRHKESLPTKSQVEPFKASLEVLLHEIIVKVQAPCAAAAPS
jgi:hypothetical protein